MSKLIIQGIAGAQGIAIGKAFVYAQQKLIVDTRLISPEKMAGELERLATAMESTRDQLAHVRAKALEKAGEEHASIFDAHIAILEDPSFLDDIKGLIENDCQTAACAVDNVAAQYVTLFSEMEDEYMRERAADLKDIGGRLLRNVLGLNPLELDQFDDEVIVIAHDLTPSDTVSLDKRYVKGFAVNIGGRTSHAAIIARTVEVPAVLGLGDITEKVQDGEIVILDGINGLVITQPNECQLDEYCKLAAKYNAARDELKKMATLPAVTPDGRHVEIAANIGVPGDVEAVLANGGDGVGLYRTEFLYMGQDQLPDEEKQFQAYKAVAESLDGKPLIIRTLDIGGDKELKCFALPHEPNPFLGWRAIRICLDRRDIFRTQLRAILRASAYGNVLIMYPMISGVGEVRQANAFLAEVKEELRQDSIPFDKNIKVGIMVEIPSAAITADIIAPEVDFFSIGTNDLCQYTLAVDRMNEQISGLYQPMHPAILRLVKNVIDVSHRHGKFTGMCGELAGEPLAAVILLGLGLDEFSMSASSMLLVKKIIRQVSFKAAKEIAEHALTLQTAEQINEYAAQTLKELGLNLD